MICVKCGEGMELVDVHYNLELEEEYGHPVEVETWYCSICYHYQTEEKEVLKR